MQGKRRGKRYQGFTAVSLAVALHGVLAVVLIVSFNDMMRPPRPAPAQVDVIQAQVVDEEQLSAELARLTNAERRKQRDEEVRQAQLAEAAREAEAMRRREEERLEELRRTQAEERQRLEEEKALAEETARKAREEERQRLAAEKKRQAEEKKQAEEARKKAEEEKRQRLAAEKKRQEEEKKQAEEARKKEEARKEAARKLEEQRRAEDLKRLQEQLAEEERKRKEEARRAEELSRLAQKLGREARVREERQRELQMITAEFSARIKVHVERFWFRPRDARDRGLSTTLNITLDDAGNVTSVRVAKSSGDRGFDLSAVRAVRKASPLPVPSTADAMATFRAFNFRFCPTCRV